MSARVVSDYNNIVFLVLLVVSWSKTTKSFAIPEEPELSPEHKACLYECLTCVELWGDNYDGATCAEDCALSDGASIDHECKNGVDLSKRYAKWKATVSCKKQCVSCAMSSEMYDERACVISCDKSSGSEFDVKCSLHNHLFLDKH